MNIGKRILICFVLVCLMLVSASCGKDSESSKGGDISQIPPSPSVAENFEWKINGERLEIIGDGGMPDYESFTVTPWYKDRNSIKEIVLYDGITSVGKFAFSGMNTLTTVHFPETVTHIGENAFSECDGLENVILPESLLVIGKSSFSGCDYLENLKIPKNVSHIGDYAFSMCCSLKSVEIPSGITSIGDYTFFFCEALTEATVPESVKSIGICAFDICPELKTIYYVGTVSEWNAIQKGDPWRGGAAELTVYCTDGSTK